MVFDVGVVHVVMCPLCKKPGVSCRAQVFAERHAHHPASLVTVLGS